MVLAVVVACTGLATAIVVARLLGLDPGFAAGLVSGALTESPAMGTATEAINALPLPEAERARYVAHIAVADAVCYIFGTAGVILFCSVVAPALLRIDLKAEALKLEQELGIKRSQPGVVSAWRRFEMRAYRVAEGAPSAGLTVAQAEDRVKQHRLFIHRIRRGDALLRPDATMVLQAGDVIALSGPRRIIVELVGSQAEEVEDHDLLDVPVAAMDIVVMNPQLAGRSLADAAQQDWTRGIYVRGMTRGGQEIPLAPGVVVERGDVVSVVGPRRPSRRPPSASARSWRRRRRPTSWCWAWPFSSVALSASW